MGYPANIQRSIETASGEQKPLGYVFMVAMQPRGPMRASRREAIEDAVNAREARVDVQYGGIFLNPLTWIAPIWP